MSTPTTQAVVTIALADLESIIQRTVKQAMREELVRLFRSPDRSALDYWEHEGPEDPAGDEELLTEALATIEQYERNPEGWKTLEEFEAELAEAEGSHELPG